MAPKSKTDNKSKAKSDNKSKSDSKSNSKSTSSTTTTSAPKPLKGAQSIQVRHILCEKQPRHLEALGALQSGRKFDDVAREYSEDKARQGGALGWQTRGALDAGFEKVAFELEASTTAKPVWAEVRTGFGWHLVMVEGRK